jgi:transcriptional regulator with XRE-family HTH domain
MAQASTPTLRRWELARRLKQHREESGLSLEDVAQQLLCSPSKISRIETAARGASLRDVRDLSRIYGLDEATQDYLMTLARETKQRGWWQDYTQMTPDALSYIGFEQAAAAIQQYETIIIPGPFQTADYTRALIRRLTTLNLSPGSEEQYASSRQQRHERLRSGDNPSYWVILDEAVVRRQVGGPKVMHDQISHLLRCVDDRQLVLQILPFASGAHAGMQGSFVMMQFDASVPDLVYIEGGAGAWYLSRDAELRLYHQAFDHLRATAVSPDDSLDLLRRIRAEL